MSSPDDDVEKSSLQHCCLGHIAKQCAYHVFANCSASAKKCSSSWFPVSNYMNDCGKTKYPEGK